MVHAHPPNLVSLGRHPLIRGSFERFNAAVYTSVEGLNRNYTGLIGVVPYRESGTKALVDSSIDSLVRHRLVLWMNHGFVVRESNIRRAYSLLGYAEDAARAALFTLTSGALGLPTESVLAFLEEHQLLDAYRSLGISTA
jgi:ribulose-5-phosphate 4-epimerase/fuculose-1-phosphate aldolase